MTDNIEWGEPIRVDGKRPEWLDEDDIVCDVDPGNWTDGKHRNARGWKWSAMKTICLPADHPHYRKSDKPLCVDTLRKVLDIVKRHATDEVPASDKYAEVWDDCAAFICGDIEVEIKRLLPKDRAEALVEEWIASEDIGNDEWSKARCVLFARWLEANGHLKEEG